VDMTVSVETPFGDSEVFEGTFILRPGQTRAIPISIPIAEECLPGMYRLVFTASTREESIATELMVEITNTR
jgi:uncharacterized membrane protein